jgi:hypothetical protein
MVKLFQASHFLQSEMISLADMCKYTIFTCYGPYDPSKGFERISLKTTIRGRPGLVQNPAKVPLRPGTRVAIVSYRMDTLEPYIKALGTIVRGKSTCAKVAVTTVYAINVTDRVVTYARYTPPACKVYHNTKLMPYLGETSPVIVRDFGS